MFYSEHRKILIQKKKKGGTFMKYKDIVEMVEELIEEIQRIADEAENEKQKSES